MLGGVALFWPLFMLPSLHSCPALIPAAPSLYMCTLLYQYSVLYLCCCSLVLNILSWYFTNLHKMKWFILRQIVNYVSCCCSPNLNILSWYFTSLHKTKQFVL